MGYIYRIYNDINDKCYIGLTTNTVETRWKKHLSNSSLIKYHLYDGYPVTKCQGNGQGVCRRCKALRRPYIYWTTWLYESGGFEGTLCYNCVLELKQSEEVQDGR